MWYIAIGAFLILGFVFSTKRMRISHESKQECKNHKILLNSLDTKDDTIKGMFSKKQIDQKLKRLSETPAPTNLSFGAMCYEMVAVDTKNHEYVCPLCGEKTVYKKDKDKTRFFYIDGLLWNLEACRKEIQTVRGINIKLDEKQFCSHCSPKIERPELYLLVNIAGQSDTTRISAISFTDIQLIREFLEDKLIHRTDNDGETPLIENIARIKELLGIK